MEESIMSSASPHGSSQKSPQELAIEGQKHLEATVGAAHQILASMNEELCNPSLWLTNNSQPPAATDNMDGAAVRDILSQQELGGGALEEARFRYRTAVASLRAVLSAISNSYPMRPQDGDTTMGTPEKKTDQAEIQRLEQRAAELREEVTRKSHYLKILIDQLRDLTSDISMWQSPSS